MAVRDIPEPAAREAAYQEDYYREGTGERFIRPFEDAAVLFKEQRVRAILRRAPGPGAILDVGCGGGELLRRFAGRGWTVLGTQLSRTAADAARRLHDVEVLAGDLPELVLPAASFDVVTFFHVLEHVERPDAQLAEARRLLRTGGLLVVEVPDFGDPFFRLLGTRHFCVDPPNHLWFFTEETLRNLLSRCGFEVTGLSRFSPEYSPYSQLQNLLNILPGEPSRLYRAMMGNEKGGRLRRETATWGHALLGILLAVPALLLSIVFPAVVAGNTLRVYARPARSSGAIQ